MKQLSIKYGTIRRLGQNERMPYALLLLADETKEAIHKYIDDAEIYVLEKNSRIIAVYVLQHINQKNAEIKNIAVDESAQGQGIGKSLLRDATKRAKDKGYQHLLIGTANGAIKQLYLYQKEGFEMVSIRMNIFCGQLS
ncbi:GNAT family N-acetyltransferase [Catalinimonas niigatensis]|uniref:GNAT family N-acetyltransferase n=1 Tax=Catalinimonas niigatensis TaxID=1397264 RepID=UPI0026662F8E|nr:GNAT family N-acetyltransferase [Catalinimonas niigatensis]WPP50702.1 GNAT family N-acetyltransferase [Catalinimonas niigatensis]